MITIMQLFCQRLIRHMLVACINLSELNYSKVDDDGWPNSEPKMILHKCTETIFLSWLSWFFVYFVTWCIHSDLLVRFNVMVKLIYCTRNLFIVDIWLKSCWQKGNHMCMEHEWAIISSEVQYYVYIFITEG